MNSYERIKKDVKEKYPHWDDATIELTAGLVPLLTASALERIREEKIKNRLLAKPINNTKLFNNWRDIIMKGIETISNLSYN